VLSLTAISGSPTSTVLGGLVGERSTSGARRDARALVDLDPRLNDPDHARMRRMMLVRYVQALELGDVG